MRTESYLSSEKPLAVVASTVCTDAYDLARQFAENGYDIIVAAGNASVVEEAEDFKELGVDAVSFQLDLTTSEGVEQLYRRIIATGRPVEAIVVNPSISSDFSHKILKDMADRGYGKILFASNEEDDDNSICDAFKEEAQGTGVTVATVKSREGELYFLKKGYEVPFMLH